MSVVRRACTALLLTSIAFSLTGCTKELNEQGAKELIQAGTRHGQQRSAGSGIISAVWNGQLLTNLASQPEISQWLNRPISIDVGDAEMSRLISSGFIIKSDQVVQYPLPGIVDGTIIQPAREGTFDVTGNFRMHLVLSFGGTGLLAGGWSMTGNIPQPCNGGISGQATMDGSVDIRFLPGCLPDGYGIFGPTWHVGVTTNGGRTHLSFPAQPVPSGLTPIFDLGGATPTPIYRLTWSSYALSPKLNSATVQPNECSIGTLRIDQVQDLTLAGSDVQSTASFNWSVDLNELGQAIYGPKAQVAGRGSASFSKKPDGTWVLSSYSL